MSTESYNSTTVSCQRFKCSGRGLILPFGIEACMSIQLRAVLYFIFLLYLFLGIAIIADIFMSAIETITSRKQKIRYPDPGEKDKYLTVEVRLWNDTVANLTLMALGSSSPEILLSIIEIVGNRFEAGELGPGTIVGSAAYNLLMISAICIASINAPETRRIKLYNVFLVTSFFGFFAYIWLFIVLSVISKDVVELWEAVVTFLMFPLVVILAYLAEKNCFLSKKIEMEEEEKLIITPPETDAAGIPRSFHKDELLQFLRDLGQSSNLSIEDKAQLFAAKLSENMHRSRMQYRIQGARMLTGGKSLFVNLPDKLQEIYQRAVKPQPFDTISTDHKAGGRKGTLTRNDIDEDPQMATLEFASSSYAVLEREQRVTVEVVRHGFTKSVVHFRLDTIDGTATAGEDYIKLSEEFVMESGQQEKKITIHVIDDNQWEPDETFFVKLSLPESEENRAKVGSKTVALVTIINDDEPGYIHFEEPINLVKESVGKAEIKVARVNGADGRVSVHYRTKDIEAVATRDYEPADSELVFEHGEISKIIAIPIMNDLDAEKDETFAVELYNPTGGATIGKHGRTVVTIINDDNYITMANKMASLVQVDMDKLSVTKTTWGQQFKDAMTVNGGDLETAKFVHYVGHTFSFFWKILFAFVPPTSIAGGWLTFFVSLLFIAILTAVVGDVAAIFGCLVGLKDSITAISFVALGTSLPDTFASMIAAKNSKTADDAIGNVTGSNSVNVFLGLGLPWLVAAVYWESKNLPFTVKAGDLSFSVLVFSCSCIIGMILLTLRRFLGVFGKAELGGPTIPKYACSIFFVFLWICYLTLSGLQAYGHIYWAA
ncbi:unnamed protein product [Rotaria magnacalcarata]|uniref:Calx-beta domain-containing protein n=1 Tax=Rotaria magnacalcarata TaxID=392030 RepID=A0A816PCQ8_9BILA|nr:unnamed protein product [Rotaria magnacalcarata]CAF1601038.1 unnamed protein product [Rotaria magnacalcarata]CAF2046932.1 unnamed protein product [Rotaria magnacalcarata]CAF2065952.1 unnamed protein product [Rotaria magnacalcarata]